MDGTRSTARPDTVADSVRALRLAPLVGGGGIALSLAIRWTEDTERAGVSWFGTQRDTVVPYAVGLLAMAVLTARAAQALPPGRRHRATRRALAAVALLLVGLVVTPYSSGPVVFALHDTVGAGLFLVQLGWAAWAAQRTRSAVLGLLTAAMLAAGLLAAASLLDVVEVMLWGQLAFQAAFAVLAPLAVGALDGAPPTPSPGGRRPVSSSPEGTPPEAAAGR